MNTWRDKTLGNTGNRIWLAVVSCIALLAIYFHTFFPQFSSMSNINRIVPAVVLLVPAAWALFYISQSINVLQEITLNGDRLSGKCYFGRRFNCAASDIKSLSYYPMTWKIRYVNLFDTKRPGINIDLRRGELVRINARTEDFSSLVDALKVFSKSANGIHCDL